tara:strand:+ start:3721 stop:4680 length:960 start_codon:yes stop_codon:yes gene_type:complete
MIKSLAIVLGEPNSINSEIIVKAWTKFKKNKNIFLIGNYLLLKQQISKIGLNIKISKITTFKELNIKNGLNILDIPFRFNSPFESNNASIKKYIFKSLEVAHELALAKKIKGFINLPINKKVFDSKYLGVTEYLAKKCNLQGKEVMMIYNKQLSVVPLTTHLELSKVTNKIKFSLIKKKILILNKSYFNIFKEKPRIAILGLNPHNSENRLNSVENKVIKPAIDELRKFNIDIKGPFPADTIFNNQKKLNYNIIVGMYHDQVLAPFKALYGYDAINVTLGLHYLRLSPDHGTAQDIIGLNMGNPQSLISAINFLSKINV